MAYQYREMVTHEGLHKCQVVGANSRYELDAKVYALNSKWNEQWIAKTTRENKLKSDENKLAYAADQTKNADIVQYEIEHLLKCSLSNPLFQFDDLKDKTKFSISKPKSPKLKEFPSEPLRTDTKYNPEPPFFTKIFKKKKEEFEKTYNRLFINDHCDWEDKVILIENENKQLTEDYHQQISEWEEQRVKFYEEQEKRNLVIDEFKSNFENGLKDAIESYISLVLCNAYLPFNYEKHVDIEYQPDSKNIIIDIFLPTQEELPSLKSVSYVKSKAEFKESFYSETQMKKKYDIYIYQMVLQTFYCIFESSKKFNIIKSAVINGMLNTVDKSTGKPIEPCILSISANADEFSELQLETIDPKAWFKSSKGVSAASLAAVTPIAPIARIEKDDKRFIEGYSVVNEIDDSMNLATMDWQDFENLIRELFEQEFNSIGGDVKITQASRDGGVDAVAFDPDPIRGGKIVIQAKRYTNVVGVSAVRDLYGTVMNEGAMKGILVTTSNYGNDAYDFIIGKPLTLLNGANLLSMLQKHGHKAKIDIKEAKKILAEANKIK